MPDGIRIGDEVYVPVERIQRGAGTPYALIKGSVTGKAKRTLTVDLPYGIGEVAVAASAVQQDVGVCLVRIGDFQSELTLLDPLAKSILQYLRLLLPDDHVKSYSVRTREELYEVYRREAPKNSHFVLVGHGDRDSLLFSLGAKVSGEELARSLYAQCQEPSVFINLCCQNGYAAFGRPFSLSPVCRALIAPLNSLHGAVAAQFLQTLLGYHFLEGRTLKVAFNSARKHVPGGAAFRIWSNGKFEGKKS